MFKMQQVLRTKVPLKSENGVAVPPNTRVVVMRMVDTDRVRVKVSDPAHGDISKTRLVSGINAFHSTHRGRPRKSK